MVRDFRFGLAISNRFGDDPIAAAVEAEASGFDVAVIGDHIGPELAPTTRFMAPTLFVPADGRWTSISRPS